MDEYLAYLGGIDGGHAWRDEDRNAPDIYFVLVGRLYAFWVPRGSKRLNRNQQATRNALREAGVVTASIRRLADLERVLGRDERRYRLHQAMPVSRMRRLLTEWGKGSYRLDWLNKLVRRLPLDERRVIMMRYMDNMPFDAMAREMYYSERQVYNIAYNAVEHLIEWAIEGVPEVKYITPGWEDEG